ncbi:hypothetical protein SH591_08775 [Sphingomonas sp. LY54]|uniref:hypothetical protein n=1 Tax=Sphingomonas sp. LY54 TaxID=3095343 RepID=UPI002D7A0968|nr:hypothetical protein [Sphingomonas sp. LY54]WRP27217.1 hypothetical protein SH591_08775 [Sphingomonas sp. LY54]
METTTPNRRELLTAGTVIGAGAAVAAVVGGTILATAAQGASTSVWADALAAYRQADDEMDAWAKGPQQRAYDAFEAIEKKHPRPRLVDELPADQRAELAAAHDAYAPYEQRFDELAGARSLALEALLLTPAPAVAALTVKLELWRENDVGMWVDCEPMFDAIITDTKRLSAA